MRTKRRLSEKEFQEYTKQFEDESVWKHTLTTVDTMNFSIWDRIKNLFYPEVRFEHIIPCKEEMPEHRAFGQIVFYSYADLFMSWYRGKFRKEEGITQPKEEGPNGKKA